MTIEQIKDELARLSDDQQDHLFAYLLRLRHMRSPELARELAEGIDDKDPTHWLSADQLREHWKE